MNVSAGLGQSPVTISCTILGENIFLSINGSLVDHINIMYFNGLGITISPTTINRTSSMITQSLIFEVSVVINNTYINCTSTADDSENAASDKAFIIIAGITRLMFGNPKKNREGF